MVVPEHEPLLYWPPGQVSWEHVLHRNSLVVPLHEPVRYAPEGQLMLLHVVQ